MNSGPAFLPITHAVERVMAQRTKQRLDDVKLTLQRLQRITSESSDSSDPVEDGASPSDAMGRAALAWGDRAMPATAQGKNRTPLMIAAGLGGVLAVGAAGFALWQFYGAEPVEPQRTAAIAVDQPERAAATPVPAPERAASPERIATPPVETPAPSEKAAAPEKPVAAPDRTAAIEVETPPVRPSLRDEGQTNLARATSEAQELIDIGKVVSARRILTDVAKQSPEAALMPARSYDPNFLRLVAEPDGTPDAKEAERWYRVWHEIASQKGLVMEIDRLERIIKAMK
jgi:hypothetical protein